MAEEKEEVKAKATNLKTRVKVVATAKHPFAEKGDPFEVHPSVAEGFLKSGWIEKYKGAADAEADNDA